MRATTTVVSTGPAVSTCFMVTGSPSKRLVISEELSRLCAGAGGNNQCLPQADGARRVSSQGWDTDLLHLRQRWRLAISTYHDTP